MAFHVVVGAGAIGARTAVLLAEAGERVRLVSRAGGGPEHERIERIAGDALDVARMIELTKGAKTIFNTAMPPYDRWPELFPPLAASLLTAAEATFAAAVDGAGNGADGGEGELPGYVMMGNTYGYGKVDGWFTEDLPMAPISVKGQVRAQIWLDALAAHEAGRVRVAEVRASAFLGAGAGSVYNLTVPAEILAGRPAAYPGDLDAPRTWTYADDAARTLIAVAGFGRGAAAAVRDTGSAAARNTGIAAARNTGSAAAETPGATRATETPGATRATETAVQAWGRAWHAPSSVMSVRELTARLAAAGSAAEPRLSSLGTADLIELGKDQPIIRELVEMMYSMEAPDLLDATFTEHTFGLRATPLDKVLPETVEAYGRR